MKFEEFQRSTKQGSCPEGLSSAVAALWHERRGDWERAHSLVADEGDQACAWVHAYLHRKEGDSSNAAYWYHVARRSVCQRTLDSEWEEIVRELLGSETA